MLGAILFDLEAYPSMEQLARSTDTDGQLADRASFMREADRRDAWRRIGALQTGPVETVTGKLFDVSLVEPERGIQVRVPSSCERCWIPARRMGTALDLTW